MKWKPLQPLWPLFLGTTVLGVLYLMSQSPTLLLAFILAVGLTSSLSTAAMQSAQYEERAHKAPQFRPPSPKGYTVLGRARWGWFKGYAAAAPGRLVFLQTRDRFRPGQSVLADDISPETKETLIVNLSDLTSFTHRSCLFGGDEIIIPNKYNQPTSLRLCDPEFMPLFHGMSEAHDDSQQETSS